MSQSVPTRRKQLQTSTANATDRTPVTPVPRASTGQSASDSLRDADEGSKENEVLLKERDTSQRSLAKYVLDNSRVTHVPECNVYIVKGHNKKKYCITLYPETCQCPSSSRCYHIIAVRMYIG